MLSSKLTKLDNDLKDPNVTQPRDLAPARLRWKYKDANGVEHIENIFNAKPVRDAFMRKGDKTFNAKKNRKLIQAVFDKLDINMISYEWLDKTTNPKLLKKALQLLKEDGNYFPELSKAIDDKLFDMFYSHIQKYIAFHMKNQLFLGLFLQF